MKILVAGCFVVLTCFAVAAQTRQSQDESLLRPSHPAYADAMEFARFLNEHNINVKSVHNSKLNGFFRGVPKAAFFKTDKGILEVIFFPNNGAENLLVIEQRDNKLYIYSFRGQPQPNPPRETFNAARPMYFITHGGWFIVTLDEKTFDAVRSL